MTESSQETSLGSMQGDLQDVVSRTQEIFDQLDSLKVKASDAGISSQDLDAVQNHVRTAHGELAQAWQLTDPEATASTTAG